MHRAIRKQTPAVFLRQEAPFLVGAFVIAELFYKFGSFTLECLSFLATWYALSFVGSLIAAAIWGGDEERGSDQPSG